MSKAGVTLITIAFFLVLLYVLPASSIDAAPSTSVLTQVFYPSDDAEVYEGQPYVCYGSIPVMRVYYLNSVRLRSFIKFNLSSIPPGSVIGSATLNLFMEKAPSKSRKLMCLKVNEPWNESAIGWFNLPNATVYESIETGIDSGVWLRFQVGPMVQMFVDHFFKNYGWMLEDSSEGPKSIDEKSEFDFLISLYSKECSDSSKHPYLEVNYYPPHLELELSNASIYGWTKLTVHRKTFNNKPIVVGTLNVKLNSTSASGKFSLTRGGTPIDQLIIPYGYESKDFWYYDNGTGTYEIHAWTEDYMFKVALSFGGRTIYVPVMNYGDDTKEIKVNPVFDNIPPITKIMMHDSTYYNGQEVFISNLTRFVLCADDDVSGVKEILYRIDEGSWSIYSKEFTLATYSDGPHIVSYHSLDNAGNSEKDNVMKVFLDKIPPLLSAASPVEKLISRSKAVNFSVKAEDLGSGVKEVELIVDGSSQGEMNKSGDVYSKIVGLSEGNHSWNIKAVDNVNNWVYVNYSFTLIVDNVPPLISELSVSSNPVFGEPVLVTCKASDDISGVKEVYLYYSSDKGFSWSKVEMTLKENVYSSFITPHSLLTEVQYYIEAVDNVGNAFKTPVAKYTAGIPIWLYAVVVALAGIIFIAILFKKKSISKVV